MLFFPSVCWATSGRGVSTAVQPRVTVCSSPGHGLLQIVEDSPEHVLCGRPFLPAFSNYPVSLGLASLSERGQRTLGVQRRNHEGRTACRARSSLRVQSVVAPTSRIALYVVIATVDVLLSLANGTPPPSNRNI